MIIFSGTLIVDDGRFGRSTVSSKFYNFLCSSSDNSLSECLVQQLSCTEICSRQYGLKCFGKAINLNSYIYYSIIMSNRSHQ